MDGLSDDELRLWHAFKRRAEGVFAGVERDIAAATGLSGADFAVLDRLRLGITRQSDLRASLGWSRSRLSHQLTRMEGRDLLRRSSGPGVLVDLALTADGRAAIAAALPVHAAAVREHLLDRLDPSEREALGRGA
jgi:DNA-binding MarR family transcriptional regulator